MSGNRTIESRIRLAAALSLLGLAVEAVTLNILHPLSFIVFASIGVLLIGLGIVIFLLALLRASEPTSG
jgi:hypothetical protein